MSQLRTFTLLPSLLLLALFCGCVTRSAIQSVLIDPSRIEESIKAPPYIEKLSDRTFTPISDPDLAQIFYRVFTTSNTPHSIDSWETHYVMGDGSHPDRTHTEIARFSFFLEEKNDIEAQARIRELVFSLGGDAAKDVYRIPAVSSASSPTGAIVLAYWYQGTVIHSDEASSH